MNFYSHLHNPLYFSYIISLKLKMEDVYNPVVAGAMFSKQLGSVL